METVELEPLDKKDLLELLDYAKRKKKEDSENADKREKWDDSTWWEIRIGQLKQLINGKSVRDSYIQSSFETIEYEINDIDKGKINYQRKKLRKAKQELEEILNDNTIC